MPRLRWTPARYVLCPTLLLCSWRRGDWRWMCRQGKPARALTAITRAFNHDRCRERCAESQCTGATLAGNIKRRCLRAPHIPTSPVYYWYGDGAGRAHIERGRPRWACRLGKQVPPSPSGQIRARLARAFAEWSDAMCAEEAARTRRRACARIGGRRIWSWRQRAAKPVAMHYAASRRWGFLGYSCAAGMLR